MKSNDEYSLELQINGIYYLLYQRHSDAWLDFGAKGPQAQMQGIHIVSISAAFIELSRENKNLLLILFALYVINRLLRSHVTFISNTKHF